jgi:plasmid stability protein
MAQILIRNLDAKVVKQLKERAKRHGRSLESEARILLEQAAGADSEKIADMIDNWKQRFAGRRFRNSAKLIREDRNR